VIERFNFYDVYGYLIPGVVLLLCVGLPFLLSGTKFELNEWTALIVGVVVAYLAGHLIQTMATTAIPSSRDSERRPWQYYSATILNPKSRDLSVKTKDRLQLSVRSWFGLDLSIGKDSDESVGAARQDAFLLARRVVNAASNYSEQFEGIYVMMRGITVALWLGIAFTLGWAFASRLPDRNIMLPLLFGSIAALLARSIEQFYDMSGHDRRAASIACIAALWWSLLAAGVLMSPKTLAPNEVGGLLTIALVYLVASLRFWKSYYFFAEQFARSVWLHFAAEPTDRPKQA
jgi:hypothetical protein